MIQYYPLQRIELETCNVCTRQCKWCPHGSNEEFRKRKAEFLETQYIESLLNDLQELRFSGDLLLFSLNEPLIDKRICSGELIRLSKKYLNPNCKVIIHTNGDLLTNEIIENFINSGLDSIVVSCYDPEIVEKSYIFRKKYQERIDFVCTNHFANNYAELKYNRAGSIEATSIKTLSYCLLPVFLAVVGFDGEIRICNFDVLGNHKVGNIKNISLRDIVNSKEYKILKSKISSNRKDIFPCNKCNYEGYSMFGKDVKYI